jgi:penicillin-binding protein 1A
VKVLSDGVTSEETSILHQNVLGGTAVRSAISCPTAAKTGTTSELVDAWLDGYTPEYSTVVWMGYPNKRVPMTDVHGEPQQGGALPAVIWHDYMSGVVGTHCVEFPQPTEPISYQPFFGKFASTGQASAPESEATETPQAKPTKPKANGHHSSPPPAGGGGPPAGAEPPSGGGGSPEPAAGGPPPSQPTGTPNNAAAETGHGRGGGKTGGTAPPG